MAAALLSEAVELVRVGLPNPLPAWGLFDLARATVAARLPPTVNPESWFDEALVELTEEARLDDPGTRVSMPLDNFRRGVPAMTPIWQQGESEAPVQLFKVHDYLVQEYLHRRGAEPQEGRYGRRLLPPVIFPAISEAN